MHRQRAVLSPLPARAVAYRVPFTVDRSHHPVYRLTNRGPEVLHGITVALVGAGFLRSTGPALLHPGDALDFTVASADPERSAVVVVRWFRPDSTEYLWRISF